MEAFRRLKGNPLNNPIRLGIMVFLLSKERATFKTLQDILELTPGNLDSHLKALEREGYVVLRKAITDRPRTIVVITEKGARETREYLKMLREIIEYMEIIFARKSNR